MKRVTLALALGALAACGQAQNAYPPQYELNFMQACEAQGPTPGLCACVWGRIAAEVPRAEFEEAEQAGAAGAAHPLAQRVTAFKNECEASLAQGTETPESR